MAKKTTSSADLKIAAIKQLINDLDAENVREKYSKSQSVKIFNKVLLPLKRKIEELFRSTVLAEWFDQLEITIYMEETGNASERRLKEFLQKHPGPRQFRLAINLKGFKYAGIHAFTCWKDLSIYLSDYKYTIKDGHNQDNQFESLYHILPALADFDNIVAYLNDQFLDQTRQQLERIGK